MNQMDESQKDKLQTYEHGISSLERKILQVCSLFQEPISRTDLLKILRRLKVAPSSQLKKAGSLDPYIENLQRHRLLDQELMCVRSMQEIIARKAAQEDDFDSMAAFITQERPAPREPERSGEVNCSRLLRDLRLALLGHDLEKVRSSYALLESRCDDDLDYSAPLLSVCVSPFDPEWMRTLPSALQGLMLADVFHFAVWAGHYDLDLLDYARQLQLGNDVPRDFRDRFHYGMAKRLLSALDLSGAEQVLAEIRDPVAEQELQAWLYFLQGQPGKAVQAFNQALRTLRYQYRSKTLYFRSESAPIHLLSLFKLQDRDSLQEMRSCVQKARAQQNRTALFTPACIALGAALKPRDGDQNGALRDLQQAGANLGIFNLWIFHLASYWVEFSLQDLAISQLQQALQDARAQGMYWFVLEIGGLLQRAGEAELSREEQEEVNELRERSALTPSVDILQPTEPWLRTLHALQRIVDESEEDEAASSEYRLAWLVQHQGGPYIELQPKLQKQNSKGQWTKGRNVALEKLFHQSEQMWFLTKEDRRLLSALQHHYSPFRGSWYAFDSLKLLPLLVGHPRLFLHSDPSLPVEFVHGEPEICVVHSGDSYVLSMTPEPDSQSLQLIRETETKFRVFQFTAEQVKVAAIFGSGPFSVPRSGYEELVRTLSTLSKAIPVHSDVGEEGGDAVRVQSDPTPCLYITPAGNGFRVDMRVRPLGASGPSFKPGTGQANLLAEVQGKRMQALRDLEEEESLAQAVEQSCPSLSRFEHQDRSWAVPDPEACLHLLAELKELQDRDSVQVLWPEGEKLSVARTISLDELQLSLRRRRNWLELEGSVEVDEGTVLQLQNLLQTGPDTRFVPLDETRYAVLSNRLSRRVREIAQLSESRKDTLRMPAQSALFLEDLEREVGGFDADRGWVERKRAIRKASEHSPSPPSTLKAELRDYQLQGYKWLSRMALMGLGACLADDMGLGKTLQALALILEQTPQGPTLVVAPSSVCSNWIAEARRFAPTLEPILYAGRERQAHLHGAGPFSLVICSYALLLQDVEELRTVSWRVLVLDEAQAIKNWSAKRTQAAMKLQAEFRMVTTGTPLENNLHELWTMFRFLNPGLLGSRKGFHERFAVPVQKHGDQEQKRVLKKIVQPFILRRLKSQVMEELPSRTEVTLSVSLSRDEAALYEAMRRQALETLENTELEGGQKHLRILAELTKLRQMCCHPRLIFPESEVPSSKLALLEDLVSELVVTGHKALVFSQFVKNLSLVRERLQGLGLECCYLDGSMSARERDREIAAFQSGQGEVFLISLKAGGTGLNLTAADYVIHLDPWWNPAVEDQAADRVHRIGQDRPVTVYRLVTEKTVEEKIVGLHAEKRELAYGLLEGSDVSHKVDTEELMRLFFCMKM